MFTSCGKINGQLCWNGHEPELNTWILKSTERHKSLLMYMFLQHTINSHKQMVEENNNTNNTNNTNTNTNNTTTNTNTNINNTNNSKSCKVQYITL